MGVKVGTSLRPYFDANPPRLGFTLITRDGRLDTTFELAHGAGGSLPG